MGFYKKHLLKIGSHLLKLLQIHMSGFVLLLFFVVSDFNINFSHGYVQHHSLNSLVLPEVRFDTMALVKRCRFGVFGFVF